VHLLVHPPHFWQVLTPVYHHLNYLFVFILHMLSCSTKPICLYDPKAESVRRLSLYLCCCNGSCNQPPLTLLPDECGPPYPPFKFDHMDGRLRESACSRGDLQVYSTDRCGVYPVTGTTIQISVARKHRGTWTQQTGRVSSKTISQQVPRGCTSTHHWDSHMLCARYVELSTSKVGGTIAGAVHS
jgi:hypothetical protein